MSRFDAVRQWIVTHDESRLFVALYLGSAVVLSLWLGLFWLGAVVGVHLLLELVRQSHHRSGWGPVIGFSLWELKLDLALFVFSLALALYLDVIAGAAGLGAGSRAVGQAGARAAVWQRTLRGILLSLDDVAHVGRALGRRMRAQGDRTPALDAGARAAAATEKKAEGGWRGPWTLGDRLTVAFGLFSVLSILATPWITDHSIQSALATLREELRPFP